MCGLTDFEPLIRLDDLPEGLAAHAREFVASGREPVAPKLAATVLLLSPSRDGYRVFMIRRVPTMPFAPGMHAFPGGSVDARDSEVELRWEGRSDWSARLGQPKDVAQAVVCAAIREVFEETGVLLVRSAFDASAFEDERAALVERRLAFADFVASHGLTLRGDLLTPWSRWITPVFEPRRYDTYFFLARMPDGQSARNVGGEADSISWVRPAETEGLATLPPTRTTLHEISDFDGVDALMAAAAIRDTSTPVIPRLS